MVTPGLMWVQHVLASIPAFHFLSSSSVLCTPTHDTRKTGPRTLPTFLAPIPVFRCGAGLLHHLPPQGNSRGSSVPHTAGPTKWCLRSTFILGKTRHHEPSKPLKPDIGPAFSICQCILLAAFPRINRQLSMVLKTTSSNTHCFLAIRVWVCKYPSWQTVPYQQSDERLLVRAKF